MKIPIILKVITFILFAFSLTCCDPGLNGDLKVFNQSNDTLTVVAFDYGHSDSLTYTIEPNTNKTIKILGVLVIKKLMTAVHASMKTYILKQGQAT